MAKGRPDPRGPKERRAPTPAKGPGRSFGPRDPDRPLAMSREPNIVQRINRKGYELADKANN